MSTLRLRWIFICTQDGQRGGDESSRTGHGDTEAQCMTAAVSPAGAVAVTLVAGKALFAQVFLALCNHEALKHNLHQLM